MKTRFKVVFLAGALGAMAACSNGNNNPQQPGPLAGIAALCSNPANLTNPAYSITNPSSPCYRPGAISSLATGQSNPNSIDIGALQAGGNVIIRNRQFQLSRGYGSENTDDSCTVDRLGDHVGRPVSRALYPGSDNLILNFDASGLLTISMQTGVGQVRSPDPVNYQLTQQGISFPAGFSLRGQPSGAYVQMESSLGFGMLRSTDKKVAEELGLSDSDLASWARGLPNPTFSGNSGINTNYVFGSGPALANSQTVVALGGTSLVGNGVNQLAMDFAPLTANVITSPTNPQHVNEIYFDSMSYQGSSVVAINGTNCQATSVGQLLKVEVR